MKSKKVENIHPSVDRRNPAPARMMIILLPIIYRVLTIPGGAGFLPSTVTICLGDGSNYTGHLGWPAILDILHSRFGMICLDYSFASQ